MTKYRYSASSTVAPSVFVINSVNGEQLLNATGVGLLCYVVMIAPLTKMQASL